MEFGKVLKEYLQQAQMSQADLSDKTGISEKTISNYVTGQKGIQLESVTKICEALKLSPLDAIILFASARFNIIWPSDENRKIWVRICRAYCRKLDK